nr:MAG TPA: hypothetical protein [Caudoviricetes sp.]
MQKKSNKKALIKLEILNAFLLLFLHLKIVFTLNFNRFSFLHQKLHFVFLKYRLSFFRIYIALPGSTYRIFRASG